MKQINVSEITQAIAKLCIDANLYLPNDIENKIHQCMKMETSDVGIKIFDIMNQNIKVAKEKQIPICQDTGMVVVFAEIGQDVHITGGDFEDAINKGVRQGYLDGYLRLSILSDPLNNPTNTSDNTPAVIYTQIVSGDKLKLTVAPKGFGSENMSALKMFRPSSKPQDIVDFVVDTCVKAGSNPCPPIIVGVGIGGTSDKAMLLSKKALFRDINEKNDEILYSEMEKEILEKVNNSKIGPQGLGGDVTALNVAICQHPSHIAGFPCGVSIGCHVTRHKTTTL